MIEHFLEECVAGTDAVKTNATAKAEPIRPAEICYDIKLSTASWEELLKPSDKVEPQKWLPLCFAPGVSSTYIPVTLEFTGKPYSDGNKEHLFAVSNGTGKIESVYKLAITNNDQVTLIEYSPAGFTKKFKVSLEDALKAAQNGGLTREVHTNL